MLCLKIGLKGRRVQQGEVSSGSMVMGGGCRWCGLYLKATPANPRCGAASGSARWQARHLPIQEMDPHLAQWEGPIPTLAQPKKWNIIYHLKHTSKQINGVTDIVGFLVFRILSRNRTIVLNHPNFCKLKFSHKSGSCPEKPLTLQITKF